MKLKKRRRLGPRTWGSINTIKNLSRNCFCGRDVPKRLTAEMRRELLKRVRENNKLAKFLTAQGWKFRDGINICGECETYYSLSFSKQVFPDSDNRRRHIHFNWHWTDQGGETFWVADMYTFYNYTPDEKYMRPFAQFEVKDITKTHIHRIPGLVEGLVAASKSQKPSYGNR